MSARAHGLDLPEEIEIREVSLRDGMQNERPVPTEDKLRILDALVAAGAKWIEATAFVSPRAIPALADADQVAARLSAYPGVRFSALVPNVRGVERALDAGLTELQLVVSASNGHSRANVGIDADVATARIAEAVGLAHESGATMEVIVATAWDCPYDGPTGANRTLSVVHAAVAAGIDRLFLGDTIGTTTPVRAVSLLDDVRAAAPGVPVGVHLHDTRGTALANAVALLERGVTTLDAAVGGLGGCPFAPGASGNLATEDLVYLCHDSGVETGLDLDGLLLAARITQAVVGRTLPSNLLRSGDRLR